MQVKENDLGWREATWGVWSGLALDLAGGGGGSSRSSSYVAEHGGCGAQRARGSTTVLPVAVRNSSSLSLAGIHCGRRRDSIRFGPR